MNMKVLKCVLSFAVALFAPVIFFSTTLLNESHPALPFEVCVPLYALAGFISGFEKGTANKDLWKWILWSAVVGAIAAVLFTVSKH
jgi:hypothetical protein